MWPGTPSSSRCTRKNSGARGLTGSTRSGRRNDFSGAPWNRSSTTRSLLPTLDVPVPQMENQLVEVCRLLDVLIPEQAIEVPKISSPLQSRRRRVRFAEQTAEQLVEVPTIVSYSSLHGLVEQNVDIPVPHGRDRVGGGLLGFLPGQSSTAFGGARFPAATAEQIVDTPVPRDSRVLHYIVVFWFAGYGKSRVFRTIPRKKKARTWARTRGRNCSTSRAHPRRRLSWTTSSRMQLVYGCGFQVVGGNFWARTLKSGGLGEGWDGANSSCVSLRTTFGRISTCFPVLCARASSHLELVHYFPCPRFWLLCYGRLGTAEDYYNWILRETDFTSWVQCLVQQWIHVLRQYSGGFGTIYTVST